MSIQERLAQYTTVPLKADLGALSEKQRKMIPLLIEAAEAMGEAFWMQAYGERETLLASLEDPHARRYAQINYGPWDRLHGNEPFVAGVGPKPPGASFYPPDVTKAEIVAAAKPELENPYTMVRRDRNGDLVALPYHDFFRQQMQLAASRLREAAHLAQDQGLKHYLSLRAEALLTDDYQPSDLAWLDMKTNVIDIVIGPIENYEDQLLGCKAAYEGCVLIKDMDWSRQLARYAMLLPRLQEELPVPAAYRREKPGIEGDLNVYDAIYYTGDCDAGPKLIAINLPNDEEVQRQKGTRRLQFKNAIRAKFDAILLPIADALIAEEQRSHIAFDAFFNNMMFHEVAHGLGISQTITGQGTVREALREQAMPAEEGKADTLGLYIVTRLSEWGELGDRDLLDNYVTFLAGILRAIRFGPTDAHAQANLVQFNFFKEARAFSRDAVTGMYRVSFDEMSQAVNDLSERLLRLQGDGDYEAVATLTERYGQMDVELRRDLQHLAEADIPVDIVFEQGLEVLGLSS